MAFDSWQGFLEFITAKTDIKKVWNRSDHLEFLSFTLGACDEPILSPHGTIQTSKRGKFFPNSTKYRVGSVILYGCQPGYKIAKGLSNAICYTSGWSHQDVPICECKYVPVWDVSVIRKWQRSASFYLDSHDQNYLLLCFANTFRTQDAAYNIKFNKKYTLNVLLQRMIKIFWSCQKRSFLVCLLCLFLSP